MIVGCLDNLRSFKKFNDPDELSGTEGRYLGVTGLLQLVNARPSSDSLKESLK
jgi:hypothetical protein